jgi:hypothetical protein
VAFDGQPRKGIRFMVGFAYDLGPRQSSRVIEQSVRQKCSVWTETIEQAQPRAFVGFLIAGNSEVITLQLNGPIMDSYAPSTGQYYQLLITMGENRYLTVSDLLEVQPCTEGMMLIFTRPKNLQVMQRRHYHRYIPGQSFPVYISWTKQDHSLAEDEPLEKDAKNSPPPQHSPALGQMRDISQQGISIRVPDTLDHHLFIGDSVTVRFSISVQEPEFCLESMICHKDLTPAHKELILGMEFMKLDENKELMNRLHHTLSHDIITKKGF